MLRTPDEITRQIQALDEVMETTRIAIEKNPLHPHTPLMVDMLSEDEKQKEMLMEELQKSLAYYRQHSLKLSFVTDLASLPINAMTDILSTFSKFIKTAHTVINNKEKTIPLYFRSTFHGSFGLLLTTNQPEALIDDVDQQMRVVFEVLNAVISDSDNVNNLREDIQKILKKDKKALNRLKSLFEKMTKNKYGVNFEWVNTDNESRYAKIPLEKSIKVYEMLSSATESEEEEVEVSSVVMAIDLTDNTFKIKINENIKTVKASAEQIQEIKNFIDKKLECSVLQEKVFNTITEKEDLYYTLISIHS